MVHFCGIVHLSVPHSISFCQPVFHIPPLPTPFFAPTLLYNIMAEEKANVVAQFYNEEGVASGPALSLPVDVNQEHLAILLNSLLGTVRADGNDKGF